MVLVSNSETEVSMSDDKTDRIRELNDQFRSTLTGGKVLITPGIHALGQDAVANVITKVRTFDKFSQDNDPYSEHDFGSIEEAGETVFWKIDYYDKKVEYGSEDPSDPEQTTRVMTIMSAEEY